jgi:PHD/YefM family antitoxin component YafN of YafNO toxin-antitoxin module
VQGRIVDRGIRKSIPQRIIAYSIDCITKFVYNFTITEGGAFMPTIKSSADLRNNYNEISTYCHNYPEPVFITKNGKGDLAVMSIEAYEELTSRFELYSQIKEGMDDIAAGNTRPFQEAMADIRSRRRR